MIPMASLVVVLLDLSIFCVQNQSYWTKGRIKFTMLFDIGCIRGVCAGTTKAAADGDLQCSSFLLFPGPAF